jgi:hypothetical protein
MSLIRLGYAYANKEVIEGFPRVPLPFFQYRYQSPDFIFSFGVITFARVYLAENLWVEAWVPVFGGNTVLKAVSRWRGDRSIAAVAQTRKKTYQPVDRPDKELFLVINGIESGLEVEKKLGKSVSLGGFAGYAFNNRYYYQEYTPLGGSREKFQERELPASPVFRIQISIGL